MKATGILIATIFSAISGIIFGLGYFNSIELSIRLPRVLHQFVCPCGDWHNNFAQNPIGKTKKEIITLQGLPNEELTEVCFSKCFFRKAKKEKSLSRDNSFYLYFLGDRCVAYDKLSVFCHQ